MWQQILDGQQLISIRTLSEATRSALQHQSPQKQQLASQCQQQQQLQLQQSPTKASSPVDEMAQSLALERFLAVAAPATAKMVSPQKALALMGPDAESVGPLRPELPTAPAALWPELPTARGSAAGAAVDGSGNTGSIRSTAGD